MSLQRARSIPLTVTADVALSQLSSISVRETAAAAAVVTLRKGSGTGAIVAEYAIPASTSFSISYASPIDFSDGVAAQKIHATVTGTITGAIHGT